MDDDHALQALAALSQATRLAAYRLLVRHAPEGLPAGRLSEELGVAPNALSFHLRELERAGLVTAHPAGRFIWYRPDIRLMNGLVGYLTDHCCVSAAVCDEACVPRSLRNVAPAPAKAARKKRAG